MVYNGESASQVISDIDCNANRLRVSKGGEVAFPHVIVGGTEDSIT